jgi:hypothetical protein
MREMNIISPVFRVHVEGNDVRRSPQTVLHVRFRSLQRPSEGLSSVTGCSVLTPLGSAQLANFRARLEVESFETRV